MVRSFGVLVVLVGVSACGRIGFDVSDLAAGDAGPGIDGGVRGDASARDGSAGTDADGGIVGPRDDGGGSTPVSDGGSTSPTDGGSVTMRDGGGGGGRGFEGALLCASTSDCPADLECWGRWCVTPCPCPADWTCAALDSTSATFCLPSCATGADCPAGSTCEGMVCLPGCSPGACPMSAPICDTGGCRAD